jgi:hypothetical protein
MKKSLWISVFCLASLVALPAPSESRHAGPPQPTQQIVLEVCHPKTGCPLQVPVCVPLCCQGPPCARYQHTLIGPGKTVSTWVCGYEVTVRYTVCGNYRVSTHG